MQCPFPGMDPYLEEPRRWPDVHQSLITYIRDGLQPAVRPRYFARMGERVYIMNPPRAIAPDIFLLRRPKPGVGGRRVQEPGASYGAPAVEADVPILIDMPPVEYREPFVEIVQGDGEVVTVIEVLSPANKPDPNGRLDLDQVRRISTTSNSLASAGGNAANGVWLCTMRRIASSMAATPLETTKLTDSTEPSLRIATVTSGAVWGRPAASATMSMVMLSWILRAKASAYSTSSRLASVRPNSRPRRAPLQE